MRTSLPKMPSLLMPRRVWDYRRLLRQCFNQRPSALGARHDASPGGKHRTGPCPQQWSNSEHSSTDPPRLCWGWDAGRMPLQECRRAFSPQKAEMCVPGDEKGGCRVRKGCRKQQAGPWGS